MKIEHAVYQAARMFGRHFDEHDELVSHITRQSIDVLKVCRCAVLCCLHALTTARSPGLVQSRRVHGRVGADQGAQAGSSCLLVCRALD